ncbi:MAG TPA: Holliday junction resolvase RuvX [Patescibacteria group bacterium]|nr:Holliday junction resolvase RuvX [Patescibacteria group bacterium]
MTKILGIDYGSSKVGLALADLAVGVAMPWKVVKAKDLNIESLKDCLKAEEIDKIVVGLPLGMSGGETAQTKEVKRFIQKLKDNLEIEVVSHDERLSTVEAAKKGKDDAVAAMYILQGYVDKVSKLSI